MDPRTQALKSALEKNELCEYIMGENGYAYTCPYADLPTDPSVVFSSLIDYNNSSGHTPVWSLFDTCLLQISHDPTYSWFSLYYLLEYVWYVKKDPVTQILPLAHSLLENLIAHKEALKKNKSWVGREYPLGLWDDAQRLIANMRKNHGLTLDL